MRFKLTICLLLSAVCHCKKGFGPGEQDWDYVEVRPGAQMFWWLYYTTAEVQNPESKPLLIWLQGGPGGSSTGIGNFEEFGPLDVDLNPRNHTWVKDYNVLFIDNPVGTGFSYVNSTSLLAENNTQIAKDLIECIKSFYKKLPEFRETPLYITSESYGGKMTIEFALLLNEKIEKGKIKSNLKGVALIDSWISPVDSVTTWAPYLLNMGMIDSVGFDIVDKKAKFCKRLVDEGNYKAAVDEWRETEITILAVTRNIDFYNILTKVSKRYYRSLYTDVFDLMDSRFQNPSSLNSLMNNEVKEALNIPADVDWSETNMKVFSKLSGDFMKPVTHIVEQVLNTTSLKVFVISGQLDLIVDTPGTYKWVKKLSFKDKESWLKATRNALTVNGIIEGYVKKHNNFGFYWVNRSGHMVPADNPQAMAKILESLTSATKN